MSATTGRTTTTARRVIATGAAALMAVTFAASCSDKTQESARETADALGEDAQKNADQLGQELDEKSDEGLARAAAEDLRARIKTNEKAMAEGPRSMAAIGESAVDVAGDPEVAGAADADGDGLDDDGKVQVNVGGASACLTLPATGDDTNVEGGPC